LAQQAVTLADRPAAGQLKGLARFQPGLDAAHGIAHVLLAEPAVSERFSGRVQAR
jgi:hypothetical protein